MDLFQCSLISESNAQHLKKNWIIPLTTIKKVTINISFSFLCSGRYLKGQEGGSQESIIDNIKPSILAGAAIEKILGGVRSGAAV